MVEDGSSWLAQLKGRFIVFDGPDGGGKTTQVQRFAKLVESSGLELCRVREPGGTEIGELIRDILLDSRSSEQMDVRCEMLLFMASRAQLISQCIEPALRDGQIVLADRFISSTLAYQGTAGGIAIPEIYQVAMVALLGHWPDLTVIFDVDESTAAIRLNPRWDRMERKGAEYHRRVRRGFIEQAERDPTRFLVVDASADADSVFQRVCTELQRRLD